MRERGRATRQLRDVVGEKSGFRIALDLAYAGAGFLEGFEHSIEISDVLVVPVDFQPNPSSDSEDTPGIIADLQS
ncbi:MAG: hypothetical protein ABI383_13645 [Acidobacteriaceae bacterium]